MEIWKNKIQGYHSTQANQAKLLQISKIQDLDWIKKEV